MAEIGYLKNITNYFKKNLTKGYTLESLKWSLIKQGYSRTIVEKAIEQVNKELAEKAPALKEKPRIKYEIIDENDKPITIKKPFWKKLVGFFAK